MTIAATRLLDWHRQIITLAHSLAEHLTGSSYAAAALIDAEKLYSVMAKEYIPKEERLLRTLEGHLETGEGSLSILFEEHRGILRILRQLIRSLRISIKAGGGGGESDRLRVANELKAALEEHFSKEENVVYWLAELRLSNREKRQLTHTTGVKVRVHSACT